MYFTEKLEHVDLDNISEETTRFVVAAVEKQSGFNRSYSKRYICFDRATRLVYLSDSGSKLQSWKRVMKVYAIGLKHIHSDLDFRDKDCDFRDLLGFTLHGVNHQDEFDKYKTSSKHHDNHKKGEKGNDNVYNMLKTTHELPNLKEISKALDAASTAAPNWGEYVEGTFANSTSLQPVSQSDDEMFKREDYTWHLRGLHYGMFHDLCMSMRDVLIADGLHVPVHGGFHKCIDPRNNLHFAHIPLHLQRYFHDLLDAVLYSCTHGELIGADSSGVMSVSQFHSYVCLTNEYILFMSEHGKALRWLPLKELTTVEYCVQEYDIDYSQHEGALAQDMKHLTVHKSIHVAGGSSPSPIQSPTVPGKTSEAFMAFVMSGSAPDVIFCPCDVFTKHDASHSIITHMPIMNVESEVHKLLDIIHVLAPWSEAKEINVDELQGNVVGTTENNNSNNTGTKAIKVNESKKSQGKHVISTQSSMAINPILLENYMRTFSTTHSREFK